MSSDLAKFLGCTPVVGAVVRVPPGFIVVIAPTGGAWLWQLQIGLPIGF